MSDFVGLYHIFAKIFSLIFKLTGKRLWSHPERKAVQNYFDIFVKNGKVPGKKDIEITLKDPDLDCRS